jgi:glycosyltransferase involved in cell wall biosynthesis
MNDYKLTIVLLTFNEENNIPDLIRNLEGLPANIFVVDSYSTDKTIPLIEEKGWKYIQHPFENYSRQRNWAQNNNPYNTEWVFHLDADERLTPELKKWMLSSFNPANTEIDGYIFGRRAIFMQQWIKSHYNYHLRLYRVLKGKCEEKAYDQHFIVDGKTQIIKKCDMSSNVCDTLSEFIIKHNRWAELEAIDIVNKASDGEVHSDMTGSPIEKTRWMKNNVFQKTPLFVRAFLYFGYRFFFKFGFLDGVRGFIFHVLQAFWFRFLVDAKVYELKKNLKR